MDEAWDVPMLAEILVELKVSHRVIPSAAAGEASPLKQLAGGPENFLLTELSVCAEARCVAQHPNEAAGTTRFKVLDDEDSLADFNPPAVVGVGESEMLSGLFCEVICQGAITKCRNEGHARLQWRCQCMAPHSAQTR